MPPETPQFSKREREMMDLIWQMGRATAGEVMQAMSDPPSYSAVRSTLAILVKRGHLRVQNDGNRYVYLPTVEPEKARRSALRHLMDTFFGGSASQVVTALLEEERQALTPDELTRLSHLIDQARKEGR